MDEVKRRANEYFLEFEGSRFYPKLFSLYWGAWGLSGIAFLFTAYKGILSWTPNSSEWWRISTYIAEIIFLGMCAAIGLYKAARVHEGAPKPTAERNAFMDDKRRAALERICGIASSKFASAAKECADLQATQKRFPIVADMSFGEIMRYIYDPDSKARILALLLAAVGTFVALLNHSSATEDFNILAAWADPGFMRLLGLLMLTACCAFGMWIGLRVLARSLMESGKSLWAISLGSRRGTNQALSYFIRDLIRLHRPARDSAQPTATQAVDSVPPTPSLPQSEAQEDVLAAALRKAATESRPAERV